MVGWVDDGTIISLLWLLPNLLHGFFSAHASLYSEILVINGSFLNLLFYLLSSHVLNVYHELNTANELNPETPQKFNCLSMIII